MLQNLNKTIIIYQIKFLYNSHILIFYVNIHYVDLIIKLRYFIKLKYIKLRYVSKYTYRAYISLQIVYKLNSTICFGVKNSC